MHRVDPFPSQVASSTGSHRNPSTRALTAAAVGEPSLLRRGQRKLVCYLKSTVVELRFRGCQAAVLCFRCDMALTFDRVADLSSVKSFFVFISCLKRKTLGPSFAQWPTTEPGLYHRTCGIQLLCLRPKKCSPPSVQDIFLLFP